MKDFIIVSAKSGKELSNAIKEKITIGYSLYAGVEVKITDDGHKFYSQTMVMIDDLI